MNSMQDFALVTQAAEYLVGFRNIARVGNDLDVVAA